jgi:hypothetical protein
MRCRLLIILFLSLNLGLMAGEVSSSETSKAAPAASRQDVQKTHWRSLILWLSSPRDWFHSRKGIEKKSTPGLIAGTHNDQAMTFDAQRHVLPLERQGRDANDSFKTFLFVRPKPGLSDIGAPGTLQDKPGQSAKDGCAGYVGDGNSADDKKLPTLTDLSLGFCMRF